MSRLSIMSRGADGCDIDVFRMRRRGREGIAAGMRRKAKSPMTFIMELFAAMP
jgi:hypothetical protein